MERRTVDGVGVVSVCGEIDHDVKDQLRTALLVQDDAAPALIVAELSGVTFMDSGGINVLVAAHVRMRAAGGLLCIAGARPRVRFVLEVAGLDTVIPCHPGVEQALAAHSRSARVLRAQRAAVEQAPHAQRHPGVFRQ
ncbi:STAS domain-containing protein [Streptomyces pilosus]